MNNNESIRKTYYVAIGLFCALFIGSVLLTVIDIKGSYEEFARLNFPSWILYPLSIAKTLGVIALLKSKSRSLKDFAFAGFLYDMLLALGGHIFGWRIIRPRADCRYLFVGVLVYNGSKIRRSEVRQNSR